jgi:hypothetical protein
LNPENTEVLTWITYHFKVTGSFKKDVYISEEHTLSDSTESIHKLLSEKSSIMIQFCALFSFVTFMIAKHSLP